MFDEQKGFEKLVSRHGTCFEMEEVIPKAPLSAWALEVLSDLELGDDVWYLFQNMRFMAGKNGCWLDQKNVRFLLCQQLWWPHVSDQRSIRELR